ncbi:methyltransferase domain-containing protein [Dactylosporangium aurantiacum]|uniref:Methyltransferase domain-containing protein n=1 Tax=Dactylosporangium aurantiacum TaxID=35754 RepID=A0A9Q9MGQ1_9ACTN|nr:class I SAM-dependent methyltransferase [Dactylosporangium aurantiacum]MDG6103629.1 methyltransferase domain-containing protein [Dactylosporangium aurantiacum]UWZ51881.1 methyltransferase domain-containing protein [Dactylosporangium aurantiacum]
MTTDKPAPATLPDAGYFDQWYADIADSTSRDEIIARMLQLPAYLRSTSLLTWQGVADVEEALRVPHGGLLLDVGCGRAGYGIEIAHRTGARLVGVDFSATALRQAADVAAQRLPAGRAEFRVGTLLDTGLPGGTADAVMCVDAVQFGEPPLAALREFRRLLKPGGRVALTCWEAADPDDPLVPPRIRAVHLLRDLGEAGFVDVDVRQRPDWRQAERDLWEAVVAEPGPDAAMRSLQEEGRRSLETFASLRRVFATATAP